MITADIGETCTNDHFGDRFTCPNCYTDHRLRPGRSGTLVDCGCGAKLRCTVEKIESSVCELVEPDAIDEAA